MSAHHLVASSAEQLPLLVKLSREERVADPSPLSIQDQFQAFDSSHPDVYVALVRLARKMKARGKRVGIGCLWEVVRYFGNLRIGEGEDYMLNNNLRSRYARAIMAQEADLEDFFDLRELRAE